MPEIYPIPAISYPVPDDGDLSAVIAPPYDVLDATSKDALLSQSEHNIAAVDLPHLPAKTLGPDEVYIQAGERFADWLANGVLVRRDKPALFVYQQTYEHAGITHHRRGVFANVPVQPFGPSEYGGGGIFPHEETFSAAKADRLKLMEATKAQLSPIFGLYSDPAGASAQTLAAVIDRAPATAKARTTNDNVLHEIWAVDDAPTVTALQEAIGRRDIFIADGHHRYNTALNYKKQLEAAGQEVGNAGHCLFVLVSMHDKGMIVLPTHRVLGNMARFDMATFRQLAEDDLIIEPVDGNNVHALEKAIIADKRGHVFGLYDPAGADTTCWIAATRQGDPLASTHSNMSHDWRQLDVAIVQALLVQKLCQPNFCSDGEQVKWKFPHDLDQLRSDAELPEMNLGVVVRPTPLSAVRRVSENGELMPQKSTFFYPKLATGLVINPLD